MMGLCRGLFLSLTFISFSYCMDTVNEEEKFEKNYARLNSPLAEFVADFKTWPKEEQDKIKVYLDDPSFGFRVDGKPAASHKYQNNITYYLYCEVNQRQIVPFVSAIDYLKKQK